MWHVQFPNVIADGVYIYKSVPGHGSCTTQKAAYKSLLHDSCNAQGYDTTDTSIYYWAWNK